jgi:hypothetical protein
LNPFFEEDITRVVSKESMINFRKCKYSVDLKYIGCTVEIVLTDDQQRIHIYYNGEPIRKHDVTTRQFNYDVTDQMKILQSNLLKDRSEDEIKAYISEHLTQYDDLGTGGEK